MKKPADKAAENAELKARLAEAEEMVTAIRSGAVDAIVTDDERVFILQGADHAYRVLVETISEGAATLTFDGTVMYCNGRLADMLGLSAERIIGGSFLGLVGPDELPGLQALLRRGRSNAARAEFRLRKGDGTLLPVLVSCNPLKIEHLGLCLVVTDLTEQKKAWTELAAERAHLEELVAERTTELREREQRLKYHLENSPLAVVEWGADLAVTQWSHEAGRIFGWEEKEALGKTMDALGLVYEEDIPVVQGDIKRLTDGKELTVVSSHRNRTKSGAVIDCMWFHSVLFDQKGHPTSVMSLAQDITGRKRAEKEIKDSEIKLRALLEAVPCSILIIDDQMKVLTVNGSSLRTFGIPDAAILNHRWGNVLKCTHSRETPEGCGHSGFCASCQVRNTVLAALEGKGTRGVRTDFEFFIDGRTEKRLFSISAAPIAYEHQKMAVLTVEDVTELSYLRQRLRVEHSFAGLQGRDEKMTALFDAIRELAESNAPVLIFGESGTGKELVASAIHNEGPRRLQRFVPVNCGALPDGLLESELFGHCKGSFTGAIRDKKGRFELADGGTIFLDEVGDLSRAMQVKLLRVLQNGSFEPVGSEKTMTVDVRIISATNKDLKHEIKAGRFREDLFYRLCVVPLTMPPLRERIYDVPLLADNFLEWSARESQREKVSLSPESLDVLMAYSWPGNVRELQNALQFAMIKSRGRVIEPHHLPVSVSPTDKPPTAPRQRKRKLDAGAVADALRRTRGNKLKAAKLLGVGRATLHRFLAEK